MKTIENSIIIPFHKDKKMLSLSLDTLRQTISNNSDIEIIIIANNSNYDEININVDKIAGHKPRIIYINENLFYPKAINLGVKYAIGKYLIFCDPDIFYIQNWLESLINTTCMCDNVGCVGAKLLNTLNNRIIDAGIGYWGYYRCHILRGLPYNHPLARNDIPVSSLCSALLRVERKIFEQVNGIDESMPYAFCDNDFTLKIRELGYQNYISTNTMAYYKSNTDMNNSKYYAFQYLREDSVAAFWQKNHNIPYDYDRHLHKSWVYNINSGNISEYGYICINISTAYNWESYMSAIVNLGIKLYEKQSYVIKQRDAPEIILTNILPNNIIGINTPVLYFVDNFVSLFNNSLWFSTRNIDKDIVVDRDANIIPLRLIAQQRI